MGFPRAPSTLRKPVRAALAAALLAMPGMLTAKTFTSTMTLNADIVPSCDVFAVPLMFGTLPTANFTVDKNSTIRVTCSPTVSFSVGIDNGKNFGGGKRRMLRQGGGGAKYLSYELYIDAAQTRRWGTATGAVVNVTTPANGAPIVLPVYGHTSGNVSAGPYVDLVTISVTF